jgi:hypothetical protein
MTQEIIEMARQAGAEIFGHPDFATICVNGKDAHDFVEAFAKLIAAKEREACAKIIDDSYETTTPNQGIPEDWLLTLSEAIRARGEASYKSSIGYMFGDKR